MDKEYKVLKDIVISKGTILRGGAQKTEYFSPHFECTIGFGKDHTASFVIDEDAIMAHSDIFE